MFSKCWLLLFIPTSLPPTKEAVPAHSHPNLSTQAQVSTPQGPLFTVPAGPCLPFHSLPCIFWSLGSYQMWQGRVARPTSLRANQLSLVASRSREARASPLLGDPGQEAEGQDQPLSQASSHYLSAPIPQDHRSIRVTEPSWIMRCNT